MKKYYWLFVLLFNQFPGFSQVYTSSETDVERWVVNIVSSTTGVIFPSIHDGRKVLGYAEGLMYYDTKDKCFYFCTDSTWYCMNPFDAIAPDTIISNLVVHGDITLIDPFVIIPEHVPGVLQKGMMFYADSVKKFSFRELWEHKFLVGMDIDHPDYSFPNYGGYDFIYFEDSLQVPSHLHVFDNIIDSSFVKERKVYIDSITTKMQPYWLNSPVNKNFFITSFDYTTEKHSHQRTWPSSNRRYYQMINCQSNAPNFQTNNPPYQSLKLYIYDH